MITAPPGVRVLVWSAPVDFRAYVQRPNMPSPQRLKRIFFCSATSWLDDVRMRALHNRKVPL
jgi:hypothetical protein